jgi:hypothetical protein
LFLTGCAVWLQLAWSSQPRAQDNPPQVGVFFDTVGNSCSATLEPWEPITAYVLAFLEPGIELGGALFSLELPIDLEVDPISILWPKNSTRAGTLTGSEGLELTLQGCLTTTGAPVVLATFSLLDKNLHNITRPDLRISIAGGTISAPDTLSLLQPNLKVCDPNDPWGYSSLIAASGTRTTFNCTAEDCPCIETSVSPITWTALRKLYADD